MVANGQSDGKISVWDIRNQERIFSIESHKNAVKKMAFSEKGIYLVSCGKDDPNLQLWDLRYMSNGPVSSIATTFTKYMDN